MSINQQLAELFSRLAALMQIRGENAFKSIAFQKVARVLEDTPVDLRQAAAQGALDDIAGVGESSRRIIRQYLETGHSADYDEVAATVPPGLPALLDIEGLGPKTLRLLWTEKSITDLQTLQTALDSGALDDLKGFGKKKLANLRKSLDFYIQRHGAPGMPGDIRVGIGEVVAPAEWLLAAVRALSGVQRAELAGSYRRRRETIGDIDIVAGVADADLGESITAAFVKLPGIADILAQGATKASVRLANAMQADLRVVPDDHFGATLLYFTGSKEHNVKLRARAQKMDLTLNEWGLYRQADYDKSDKQTAHAPPVPPVASKTESDVYRALDLTFIPPELREDRGEIELAESNSLPVLLEPSDVIADLHTHTTASDGAGSIEQMIEAARAIGYKIIAITDHSKSQVIANGLSPERMLKHIAAIRKIAEKTKDVTVLAGAEVDILSDGHLDYDDAILAELDIVIASPHFALKQDSDKATDRLLRAIEHRYVNIIGHPTGRLIGRREGLTPDLSKLFAAAAKAGTAMEINASYPRLDLNDRNARVALDAGVMLSINTDAHSPEGVGANSLGVAVARRAGATAPQVINCWPANKLRRFLAAKR